MSDTAAMLAETTTRLLTGLSAPAHAADPALLLARLREAGLDLALVPEAAGGVGCGLAEAAAIARAWGMQAAALPIVELLLAPRLVGLAGRPELAAGATVAQPRAAEGREGVPRHGVLEAPLFPGCETVLAPLAEAGEDLLAVLPADGAHVADLAGNAWIRIDGNAAKAASEKIDLPHRSLDMLAAEGALLTAVLAGGAMDRVVAMMIDHANTRVQFGRPIGKFQAVQHLIADASAEATVTRSAVEAALRDADRGALALVDWLSAKAQAGRATTLVAAAAHQLLGAIGFTEEHELHHFTKRLWWWRDDWGRQADCETRLGTLAASSGGAGLWPAIVGE